MTVSWPDRLIEMEREVTGAEPVTIKSRGHAARLWAEEIVRFALTLANIALFLALSVMAFGT